MRDARKWLLGATAVAAAAVIGSMALHHANDRVAATPHATAELVAPQVPDAAIVSAIRQANVAIDDLSARNVGGIVVLRGSADAAAAAKASDVVKTLGFARVANLITAPRAIDDDGIRRNAERQLANTRGLDGCTLRVSCERGVLRLQGTARSELQVDIARTVLRGVEGAKDVRVELQPAS